MAISENIFSHFVSKIKPLELKYAGELINNLSVTKIFFWNSGRDTIRKLDIPKIDKPRVIIKNHNKIYRLLPLLLKLAIIY